MYNERDGHPSPKGYRGNSTKESSMFRQRMMQCGMLKDWDIGSLGLISSSDNLCDLRQFSLSQSLSPHSLKNGDPEIFKVLSIFKILLFYDSKPVN